MTATYDLGSNPKVMATVNGAPQYGLIFAERNQSVSYGGVQHGKQVIPGYLDADGRLNDGAGNLWLDLVPNLGAAPAGSYYVVTVNVQGQVHAEIWVVPETASVDADLCRQAQAPSPAQPALYYQRVEKSGEALPQRLKLNLLGDAVACADNAGQSSTDCTFTAGAGGGSSAHNLLSAAHPDTSPAGVQRGALVSGQGSTPAWTLLPLGSAGKYLKSSGTDLIYSSGAASGVGACATHNFATALNADAAPDCARPDYADLTGTPQLPASKPVISHQFLNSFDAVTGTFTAIQPAASDVSGLAAVATSGAYSDLMGTPALYNQTIAENGTSKTQRATLNLVSGANATVSCADNAGAGRTDCTISASASSGMTNPMTTLGDLIYENSTPAPARLAGNTTATKKYLSQTGTGSVSAAPAWSQVAAADVSGLATVATTGAYSDLSGKPTLPANTTATLHQFFTAYNSTSGGFTKAQPACADLSDASTGCSITVGTAATHADTDFLSSSTVLPSNEAGASNNFLIAYNSTTGAFSKAQPGFSNLSGQATNAQLPSAIDFTGKTSTAPFLAGLASAAPATCAANKDFYVKTDATAGQQLFICNSTGNGWNLVGDGGGGGSMTWPGTAGLALYSGSSSWSTSIGWNSGTSTMTGNITGNAGGSASSLASQYVDWTASSGGASIANKPTLATVATSGAYGDLTGKPSLNTVATDASLSSSSGALSVVSLTVGSSGNLNLTAGTGGKVQIRNAADTSKIAAFDVSNIASSTTRTVTVPNANSVLPQSYSCTNQVATALSGTTGATSCSTLTLASAMFANQGTTTTVLHGNASGQPSFGAIVGGDMTAGTVTSTQLAAANKTITRAVTLQSPATGDSYKVLVFNEAKAVTLTRVWCSVDSGTSVTINLFQVTEAAAWASGTQSLTGDLVCNGNASTTSFADATVPLHVPLKLEITAVSGTVNWLNVSVEYTID